MSAPDPEALRRVLTDILGFDLPEADLARAAALAAAPLKTLGDYTRSSQFDTEPADFLRFLDEAADDWEAADD